MESCTVGLQTFSIRSAFWVLSSAETASRITVALEVTAGEDGEPETIQGLPVAGAVMSTHEPVVAEIVAPPDLTAQWTWFVTPLVTLAKMRRTDPGMRLKPKLGWPIATEMPLETGAGVIVTDAEFELAAM